MGNSCTRIESQISLSQETVYTDSSNTLSSGRRRGRWSIPGAEQSVDLDALIDAPSPKKIHSPYPKKSKWKNRTQAKSTTHGISLQSPHIDHNILSRTHSMSRQDQHTTAMIDISYRRQDPVLQSGDSVAMLDLDNDLILGTPPYSPSVIHARWGEPVDDPEEINTCSDFMPNPFKIGFCVNCQKQHDVTLAGDIASRKEFKKIARPVVARTAANAEHNPAALNPTLIQADTFRESEVDLALLLKQRRDILLKLHKLAPNDRRVHKRRPVSYTIVPNGESCNASLANLQIVSGRKAHNYPYSEKYRSPALRKSVSSSTLRVEQPENIWL